MIHLYQESVSVYINISLLILQITSYNESYNEQFQINQDIFQNRSTLQLKQKSTKEAYESNKKFKSPSISNSVMAHVKSYESKE